ncbi:hypothetical protein WN943_011011 [Citrus x changshan-huyou]
MAFTDFVVVGCSGVAAADDSPVILSTVFADQRPVKQQTTAVDDMMMMMNIESQLRSWFVKALIFLLAIIVWTTNRPMEYNYDDELIALRQQIQQPLINRPTPPEQLRLLLVPLINVLAEMILGVPIREKIRA